MVYQVAAEAIVPLNNQDGRGVGVTAELEFFLDDLAPSLFAKPLLEPQLPVLLPALLVGVPDSLKFDLIQITVWRGSLAQRTPPRSARSRAACADG